MSNRQKIHGTPKAPSAYVLFFKDMSSKFKLPDKNHETMANHGKMLSKMWSNLPADEKAIYIEESNRLKREIDQFGDIYSIREKSSPNVRTNSSSYKKMENVYELLSFNQTKIGKKIEFYVNLTNDVGDFSEEISSIKISVKGVSKNNIEQFLNDVESSISNRICILQLGEDYIEYNQNNNLLKIKRGQTIWEFEDDVNSSEEIKELLREALTF